MISNSLRNTNFDINIDLKSITKAAIKWERLLAKDIGGASASATNISNSAQIQYSIKYKYIQQCTNTVQHQIQIYPTLHKYTTNISNSTQIKIEKYKYIQQCTNTNTSNSAQIEKKQIQMYPTVHKYNTASVTMIYNSAQIQYRISHKYTQQCKNTKINNSAQLQICPTMHKYKLKLEWHSAVQY